MLTSSVVGILWEVLVPRVIVLLVIVVALDVMRRVINRVLIMINACIFIDIIVV